MARLFLVFVAAFLVGCNWIWPAGSTFSSPIESTGQGAQAAEEKGKIVESMEGLTNLAEQMRVIAGAEPMWIDWDEKTQLINVVDLQEYQIRLGLTYVEFYDLVVEQGLIEPTVLIFANGRIQGADQLELLVGPDYDRSAICAQYRNQNPQCIRALWANNQIVWVK